MPVPLFQFLDSKDGHKWKPREWIAHQVWCQKAEKCTAHFLSILKEVAANGVATKDIQPPTPVRSVATTKVVLKGSHVSGIQVHHPLPQNWKKVAPKGIAATDKQPTPKSRGSKKLTEKSSVQSGSHVSEKQVHHVNA